VDTTVFSYKAFERDRSSRTSESQTVRPWSKDGIASRIDFNPGKYISQSLFFIRTPRLIHVAVTTFKLLLSSRFWPPWLRIPPPPRLWRIRPTHSPHTLSHFMITRSCFGKSQKRQQTRVAALAQLQTARNRRRRMTPNLETLKPDGTARESSIISTCCV
jgi:hypothetical protein